LKIEAEDFTPDACESKNRTGSPRFTVGEMFVLATVASQIVDNINQDIRDVGTDVYYHECRVTNAANRIVMSFKSGMPRAEANLSHDSIDEGSALVSVEIVGGLSTPGTRQLAKALSRCLI